MPIQAQVTLDTSGRMLLGTDIAAAATILDNLRRGRDRPQLLDRPGTHARVGALAHREHARCRSRRIPNAGLPLNVGGKAVYPDASRSRWPRRCAEFVARVRRQHRRRLLRHDARAHRPHRRAPGELARPPRSAARRSAWPSSSETRQRTRCSSPRRCARPRCTQDPAPLLVGERVNAQGSRKVKQALLADDYDTLLAGRARAGGGRRARAGRAGGADRARRRGRADAPGRSRSWRWASRRRW